MCPSEDDYSLAEAIQQLSSKKKQVVSEGALSAKADLDASKEGQDLPSEGRRVRKNMDIVEEFTASVRLLVSIFKRTQFDQLALFITNPTRVLILNFFIGILRGIGFTIGVMMVMGVVGFFLFPDTHFMHTLFNLLQLS